MQHAWQELEKRYQTRVSSVVLVDVASYRGKGEEERGQSEAFSMSLRSPKPIDRGC
jgi:hypothetical protein